jgi:hypothetical protein
MVEDEIIIKWSTKRKECVKCNINTTLMMINDNQYICKYCLFKIIGHKELESELENMT